MSTPVQQVTEDAIADHLECLMVQIARIKDRSIFLNITMGVLVTLATFLRTKNLQGFRNLAQVCDRELNAMRDN